MDPLVNLETGEIDWDAIKKLSKDTNLDTNLDTNEKKFYCIKCKVCFYNKNYQGNFPLCIKHRNNTFKNN